MTFQCICVSSALWRISCYDCNQRGLEGDGQADVARLYCMACPVRMMPLLTNFYACIWSPWFVAISAQEYCKLLWTSGLHHALLFWSFVCLLILGWVISMWLYKLFFGIGKIDTDILLWVTLNSIWGELSLWLIPWLYVCWSAPPICVCKGLTKHVSCYAPWNFSAHCPLRNVSRNWEGGHLHVQEAIAMKAQKMNVGLTLTCLSTSNSRTPAVWHGTLAHKVHTVNSYAMCRNLAAAHSLCVFWRHYSPIRAALCQIYRQF